MKEREMEIVVCSDFLLIFTRSMIESFLLFRYDLEGGICPILRFASHQMFRDLCWNHLVYTVLGR